MKAAAAFAIEADARIIRVWSLRRTVPLAPLRVAGIKDWRLVMPTVESFAL